MFSRGIAFDSVAYLSLLALLPVLWWAGLRSLSGLGRIRRLTALVLRSLVLVLVILALAEMQYVRTSDRLTVLYLIDQSLSIPDGQRRAMIRYVNESIKEHRDKDREDRAGVIAFGRDATVEIPPIDEHVPVPPTLESLLDPDYTDLAGAMKLSQALFPHDAAKRIVIVTDGNENLGDAQAQAQALVDAGVSIDVVPIRLQSRGEVAIEKLTVSSDVRRGQPFDLRVVVNNTTEKRPGSDGLVRGKLRITRSSGGNEEVLAEQPVELPTGKRVLTIREQIDQPDFYNYEARFVPDDPADDALTQNNRATTFTHVRGRGHVLLIEDWANKGEFDFLAQSLRKENLEVTIQPSDQLFTTLAELQRYDTVILANVPRISGEEADDLTNFSDAQLEMLTRNTQQMGSGLVMIGGPNSFGGGGWNDTELEKAMPVDFEVKSAKVEAVGALALIMHAGEMARGNYWQKVVSREAIKALGHHDYCGLIHWNGTDQWLWRDKTGGMIRVGPNRKRMLARLDRMTPGDMPQFDPAMVMATAGFAKLDASAKHMIIISDGDPSPSSPGTLQALKKQGVKVSTVAVGSHGTIGSQEMQRIARVTGGKYYVVKKASALPKIYQKEARRVARPLVYEDKAGMVPKVKFPHEMIKGLEGQIPPITGFMLTTVKDNPLVEVSLVSPKPAGEENATVLASWTYGLGKSVALTTDAGKRWATSWTGWEDYDKLFSQVIRWSMRPVADTGKFTMATDVEDGKGQIVITALDKDDEYLNFLDIGGTVVGPDMKPIDLRVRQTAPGRYIGQFDADASGSYFVMVNPGPGRAPLRTGVNVAYSDEFRHRDTNLALLKTIASRAPQGGVEGQVIEGPDGGAELKDLLAFNPFRRDLPKSKASEDIWHLLMLAACCLFFADVFNRRVNVSFAWAPPLAAGLRDKVLGRKRESVETETMSRLQSRKALIDESLEQKRAAARFEPQPDAPVDVSVLEQPSDTTTSPKPTKPSTAAGMTPEKEEDSYTERLLKAKKTVWQQRDKK